MDRACSMNERKAEYIQDSDGKVRRKGNIRQS
jgi:hypothetical protein